ncbi:MAG: amidohydrolase [Acidobacteriota bacterium]
MMRLDSLPSRLVLTLGLVAWAGSTPVLAETDSEKPAEEIAETTNESVVSSATDDVVVQLDAGEESAWAVETPERPAAVLVRGATIWTSGPEGRLENADLLVQDGRVVAVGAGLEAPRGALVVDAAGKHVTPGLIDAHSHTAIDGAVNEATNITTAEVRIGDVVDSEDVNIYRQLAGGVTAANLLHGSANAIGGQNAVIKMRWGATPDELIFDAAPQGIKFALGENPKQSNWQPDEPRYPQTRQGVEQAIRERFLAAVDYRDELAGARRGAGAGTVPPRRDLQLEALVEILDGERLVHAHSYRADEILMLLDVGADFGFPIATFQHVLEGYKVADELAAYGAGASTFSDWWAYKFEVVDAIPHNGYLMWDRDVVVSFNSDSNELARRLNLEAAKAVRYGGVPEDQALRFVTINPAIQLGIDDRVGSLEVGKDADFVVWSGSPLSTYSRVEQTWLDGRKYFDREDDLARRAVLAAERQELIDAVRAAAEEGSGGDSEGDESSDPVKTDAGDPLHGGFGHYHPEVSQ